MTVLNSELETFDIQQTSYVHREEQTDHTRTRTDSHRGSVKIIEDSFLGEKPDTKGTSTAGAVFIVMNATLGAAILALPYAANQCGGLMVFLIMQYIFAALAGAGLIFLAKCADMGKASVYQEVVYTMTQSDVWVTSVRVIISLYAFASCIAYLVLVGDQGQGILQYIVGNDAYEQHSGLYRKLIILILSLLFVLPLMLPRSISFLELPGLVSFISVLYVVLAVISLYGSQKLEDVQVKTKPEDGKALFNALPTIAFGYQCHVSGVPVYCSLKKRNIKNWVLIVFASLTTCSLVYSFVTIFGYLTFGDQIADDILLSYPTDNIAVLIARFGVMVSVMMSYPVIHYCGRVCLEDVYRKIMGLSNIEGNRTWTVRYYVQTVLWFAFSLVGAMFIPGISKVVNLIGAFAAFFILGFPGVCVFRYGIIILNGELEPGYTGSADYHNITFQTNPSKNKAYLFLAGGCIYIVLCAFLFGEATTAGLIDLF